MAKLVPNLFLSRLGVTEDEAERFRSIYLPSQDPDAPASAHLTDRERQVFSCIGMALKSSAIAKGLGISTKTLDIHRANIGRKLGVSSSGIVRFASRCEPTASRSKAGRAPKKFRTLCPESLALRSLIPLCEPPWKLLASTQSASGARAAIASRTSTEGCSSMP